MKRLKSLIIASLLILLHSYATASSAFEKGYYDTDDKLFHNIFSVMDSPDRVLQFDGIDSIDASVGKLLDPGGARIYLSRAQLKTFFQKEKQKNILLVWI